MPEPIPTRGTKRPAFGTGQGATFTMGCYGLLYASPCVNKGTNQTSWMTGALDLAGVRRILQQRVDMGAYETAPPAGSMFVVR